MKFSGENLRLYAVTDRKWTGRQSLREQVEAALRGGATLVQLREKSLDEAAFVAEAREMACLCHAYGVPLIINDNVDVALSAGADGVHVGQGDLSPQEVRARVRTDDFIVGVSAHNVTEAIAAEQAGASYLGCGAVFGTATKHNVTPLSRDELARITSVVHIPVCAIGGISRENLPQLAGTGIDGVALVSAVFAAADIERECQVLKSEIANMLKKLDKKAY